MASLPPNVAVQYTRPTALQTASAFFVGNFFANFLFLVVLLAVLSKFFDVLYFSIALVVAYYGYVATSKAHQTGGLAWLRPYLLPLTRPTARYFDVQQIHEGGLREGSKYIFCCHPHGIHGWGTMLFMDDISSENRFYQLYPFLRGRVVGLVAWILFYLPLVRELFLSMGARDASRSVAEDALAAGNSLYLIVGGEAESLRSLPGTDEVVAAGKKRKGFVKLALKQGAALVPVYMYHNTDTYQASRWLFKFRRWISKQYQVCLPLWWGRFFTPLPFNIKMTVAVGEPVPLPQGFAVDGSGNAPSDVVDAYHSQYLQALEALFEKHKAAAGYPPERKLVILESE